MPASHSSSQGGPPRLLPGRLNCRIGTGEEIGKHIGDVGDSPIYNDGYGSRWVSMGQGYPDVRHSFINRRRLGQRASILSGSTEWRRFSAASLSDQAG